MPITNAREKFAHELARMLDAEHRFLEAMRQMRESATSEKLQTMLEEHMQQTEEQIRKLEQVFSELGENPERQECAGARGLIEEASKAMHAAGGAEIRDTAIVSGAIKVEHYEMTGYLDLIDGAQRLKMRRAIKLLTQNREQEVSTARKLERLAPKLNMAAA